MHDPKPKGPAEIEKPTSSSNGEKLPRLMVTVDLVVFSIRDQKLQVLLIRRREKPLKGKWALPGGFVVETESLEAAARRELSEKTGIGNLYLEQLQAFGEPARDPRGRVISVSYIALIPANQQAPPTVTDASEVAWHPLGKAPPLVFDHDKILLVARERLKNKLENSSMAFQLLPEKFTLTELQAVYEIILERKLDKRNFRRKLSLWDLLEQTREQRMDGAHRPAHLYQLKGQHLK